MNRYLELDLSTGLREVTNDRSELQLYEDFKLVKRSSIHEALGIETRFDAQRTEFRIAPSKECEAVLSTFPDVVTSSQDHHATWDDVLDYIEKAKVAYRDKGDKNSLRDLTRRGHGFAHTLESLTEVIPDEMGLSFLRASLSFLFRAWINRLDNVEQLKTLMKDFVYTALFSIRQLLAILLRTNEIDMVGKLETKTSAFQAVDKTKKAFARFTKGIVQQFTSSDTQTIKEIVSSLEGLKRQIHNHVDLLDRQRNADNKQTYDANLRETKATRQTVNDINQNMNNRLQEVRDALENISQQNMSESDKDFIRRTCEEAVKTDRKAVLQQVREEFAMSRQGRGVIGLIHASLVETIHTELYKLISEDQYKKRELEWASQTRNVNTFSVHHDQHAARMGQTYSTVPLTTEEILTIIDVNPNLSIKDEESILKEAHQMSRDALAHASGLMTFTTFQAWLTGSVSSVLVVDGHCGDSATSRTSALSVFCASLAASLTQCQWFIILDYFCGQHLKSSGTNSGHNALGPRGLIRSLISQLLSYPGNADLHLDFVEEALYNGLREGKPTALSLIFERILQRVDRSKTIFCIIDGVSDFETSRNDWSNEMDGVIDALVRMAGSNDRIPPMKLLIATSAQSRILRRHKHVPWASLASRQVHNRSLEGREFGHDIQRLVQTP